MTYQQRQLLRYEPKYEGDPRESPLRQNYDPRLSYPSQRPDYQQVPTNQRPPPQQQQQHQQHQQQQQHQQYQYPSDDGIYHRTRPRHGENRGYEPDRYEAKKFDYRFDDRFHRPVNEHMHQQEKMYEQQHHQYEQKAYQDRQHEQKRYQDHQYEQKAYNDHQYEQKAYQDHGHHHHHQQYYDDQHRIMQPAGRANNYSTKITDLLTSIRDPQQKDDTMLRQMEANKGYLIMMRFSPTDLGEVITAVQENLSTLAAHQGYVIGFSDPRDMQILIPSNQMMASDQWWDPRNRASRFAVCCMWFKDINQAKRWFDSATRFKQPDFPNSRSYQVIAVPLTYGQNKEPLPFGPDRQSVTLLWSEFPNIHERGPNDFKESYSIPAQHCMKAYGAHPHVSISEFRAGWGPEPNKFGQPEYIHLREEKERVARAIHTGWVAHKTFITVSAFPTLGSVMEFYTSDAYHGIRSQLNRFTEPVFVAIRLQKVKGTTRY